MLKAHSARKHKHEATNLTCKNLARTINHQDTRNIMRYFGNADIAEDYAYSNNLRSK